MTERHPPAVDVLDREDGAGTVAVNRFLGRFHSVEHAVPSAESIASLDRRLPGLPAPVTVLAREKGRVIGAATAWTPYPLVEILKREKGPDAARKILTRWRMFTHMAVQPGYRGEGLGRALVDRLESECRNSGAVAIFGFAEDLPQPSWPFYERLGYRILPIGEYTLIGGVDVGQDPRQRRGRSFNKLLR